MDKVKVGIVGCGNISDIYFTNCKELDVLEVAACADLDLEKAHQAAAKHQVEHVYTVQEMLDSKDIELIINLTPPAAHVSLCLEALHAGKHVYVEKPIAIKVEDGKRILELAKEKGLLVGSAPDTFLGGGIQMCRKLIDDGWIGRPVAANAFMMGHGPEAWHPNPNFFYQEGGGPLFDMGPYYLTTLIYLLGPVKRVTASASISVSERTIKSKPLYGKKIQVHTPTHISGVLDFKEGTVATLITSFDVWGSQVPRMEIHGTEGTLSVPDPNTFGGPILLKRPGANTWEEIPILFQFTENSRGIGVGNMALAIRKNDEHRANGELALHVLEIMHGLLMASETNSHYFLESTCQKPTLVPQKDFLIK
ncbi:Gfo/Idh/MocA family oxidoreductase [Alkalihalophilus pseudofirmus]|uniref:Gfo/Idh/MocA family protein n=1 Tax=Alkalihalophilus pseudofirmus TaxID=79885 RepID=UPI00259BD9DB|nr:Gfo/Idh/MocA family oxidoreductase [Alkalihalophilus pseudofirmus]WEG18860.1 Gfo/Idh/MocA family oxidoreductase [Alkalihalophilus pseudofirmus]